MSSVEAVVRRGIRGPYKRTRDAALDRIDAAILRALQLDARISNLKLSDVVNLSPSAVSERVKRLSETGYITGFRTRINADKLGVGQTVFVKVTLEGGRQDIVRETRAAIDRRPEILDCYMMAGDFDFLLKIRVPDMYACREVVEATFRELVGIKEIRSYAVMSQLKESDWLPI